MWHARTVRKTVVEDAFQLECDNCGKEAPELVPNAGYIPEGWYVISARGHRVALCSLVCLAMQTDRLCSEDKKEN